MKFRRSIVIMLFCGLCLSALSGCGAAKGWQKGDKYPVATIELTDGGKILVELYPDKAPNTVNNFISLANKDYYVGKVFHRAVENMMIQGGSPKGDGLSTGFPYAIKGEFSANGFHLNKDLLHEPGVISMARISGNNDSGSCQFFIIHSTYPSLDGEYAAFGQVTEGMDIVDRIAKQPKTGPLNDQLIDQPMIKAVTVETFGVNYPEPETLPPVG